MLDKVYGSLTISETSKGKKHVISWLTIHLPPQFTILDKSIDDFESCIVQRAFSYGSFSFSTCFFGQVGWNLVLLREQIFKLSLRTEISLLAEMSVLHKLMVYFYQMEYNDFMRCGLYTLQG